MHNKPAKVLYDEIYVRLAREDYGYARLFAYYIRTFHPESNYICDVWPIEIAVIKLGDSDAWSMEQDYKKKCKY